MAQRRPPVPRWLLGLVVTCAMLFAPMAMASGCAAPAGADRATMSRCGSAAGGHAPAKQIHCMGICHAVEVGVSRIAAPMSQPLAAMAIAAATSPGGILLERDTPPPRRS